MINTSTLQAPQGYIVQPVWDKFTTKSGLLLGEESYEHAEDMAVHLYPTRGIVVATEFQNEAQPGDELYFTWNGISFNRCVSPIDEQNLFAPNKAWFAYKQNGVLYSCRDFLLLKPTYEEENESASGLLLGGHTITGKGEVERIETRKNLHGRVFALPKDYAGILKIGDHVCMVTDSDVDVEIDDTPLYRTRFSELLYRLHE